MDVAFVSGALQVVCAVVNNVMGKQPKEESTLKRQMELAKELEEAKMRCRILELELADVTIKLEKENEIAKTKRLKFAVQQLQLQIRWQKLERLHRSPFGRIWHWFDMQSFLGIASLFIFGFALCACMYSLIPILSHIAGGMQELDQNGFRINMERPSLSPLKPLGSKAAVGVVNSPKAPLPSSLSSIESPKKLNALQPSALASFAMKDASLPKKPSALASFAMQDAFTAKKPSALDIKGSSLNKYSNIALPKNSTHEQVEDKKPVQKSTQAAEEKEAASTSSDEEKEAQSKAVPSSPSSTSDESEEVEKEEKVSREEKLCDKGTTSSKQIVLTQYSPSLSGLTPEQAIAENEIVRTIVTSDANQLFQFLQQESSMAHLISTKDSFYHRTVLQITVGLSKQKTFSALLKYPRLFVNKNKNLLEEFYLDMISPLDVCGCSILHHMCWSRTNYFPCLSETDSVLVRLIKTQLQKLDQPDTFGHTPLAYAALNGQRDIISGAFNIGCGSTYTQEEVNRVLNNANSKSTRNLLLLGFESYEGCKSTEYVAEHGIEYDKLTGTLLLQPLHKIVASGSFKAVQKVLAHYENEVHLVDANGWTPLHHATQNTSDEAVDIIEHLLQYDNIDINAISNQQKTPLHLACGNSLAMVQILLEYGANPNSRDNKGLSPLHYCAQSGALDILRHLLQHVPHCNANALCHRRQTILHVAAKAGHYDVVHFLSHWDIEKGLWSCSRDVNAKTPVMVARNTRTRKAFQSLWTACANGRPDDVTKWLDMARQNSTVLSISSETPWCKRNAFHVTINGFQRQKKGSKTEDNYLRVLHQLCREAPECILLPDTFGVTPLMLAAISGSISITKLLVHHATQPIDQVDHLGNNALHYAYAFSNLCIVRLLENAIDSLQAQENHAGNTPIDVTAIQYELYPSLQSLKRVKKQEELSD